MARFSLPLTYISFGAERFEELSLLSTAVTTYSYPRPLCTDASVKEDILEEINAGVIFVNSRAVSLTIRRRTEKPFRSKSGGVSPCYELLKYREFVPDKELAETVV